MTIADDVIAAELRRQLYPTKYMRVELEFETTPGTYFLIFGDLVKHDTSLTVGNRNGGSVPVEFEPLTSRLVHYLSGSPPNTGFVDLQENDVPEVSNCIAKIDAYPPTDIRVPVYLTWDRVQNISDFITGVPAVDAAVALLLPNTLHVNVKYTLHGDADWDIAAHTLRYPATLGTTGYGLGYAKTFATSVDKTTYPRVLTPTTIAQLKIEDSHPLSDPRFAYTVPKLRGFVVYDMKTGLAHWESAKPA